MDIDFSKYFLPEKLTPLYYTPVYEQLEEIQRRRYNQITGLYFNEQFIFFESSLSVSLLHPLLSNPEFASISPAVGNFIREETAHAEMFRRLNLLSAPELYEHIDYYFIDISRAWWLLWRTLSRRPGLFPFFIWLVMIQEEKAVYYANEFLKSERRLEPHYYQSQRKHLDDEESHFDYNTQLLDLFWENKGPVLRRLNAWLFEWVLKEFFTVPKRSGLKVLDHWLGEFPEIQHWRPEIEQHYGALSQNAAYICSLYSPTTVPQTLDRINQQPELGKLGSYLGRFWKELEAGV